MNDSVHDRSDSVRNFAHRIPDETLAAMFNPDGTARHYDASHRPHSVTITDPVKLAEIEQRIRRSRAARVAALEAALPRERRAEFRRLVRRDDLARQHRIPLAPILRSSGHANAHARCWNRRTPRRRPGRTRRRARSSDGDGDGGSPTIGGGL